MNECRHPEMRPTAWNQPRPPPAQMVGPCIHVQSCPVCGSGFASFPCPCTTKEKPLGCGKHGKPACPVCHPGGDAK